MKKIIWLGRFFFAIAFVAFGTLQIVRANFVRLVPELPAAIPWHSFWACLVGVLLVVIGWAIATGKSSRVAAAVLAGLLFFMLALLYAPQVATNPKAGFMWTNPCKTLALLGGALLLAGVQLEEKSREVRDIGKWEGKLALLASIFLGIFLCVAGVQHFVYADFVVTLVPKWLPGLRFWAYFTGVALIAGGIGIILPKTTRSAAAWSGLMIFLWFLLLHIPRALADLRDTREMDGVFEALALSGVAFLICGTRSRERARK